MTRQYGVQDARSISELTAAARARVEGRPLNARVLLIRHQRLSGSGGATQLIQRGCFRIRVCMALCFQQLLSMVCLQQQPLAPQVCPSASNATRNQLLENPEDCTIPSALWSTCKWVCQRNYISMRRADDSQTMPQLLLSWPFAEAERFVVSRQYHGRFAALRHRIHDARVYVGTWQSYRLSRLTGSDLLAFTVCGRKPTLYDSSQAHMHY